MAKLQTKDLSERDVLDAIVRRAESRARGEQLGFPDQLLADRFPVKIIMAKLDKLDRRGVLDYGVSLRSAWIEDVDWLRRNYPDLADRYEIVEPWRR